MIPNQAGQWHYLPIDIVVDVYPLDPVGGVLCIWGPDVGMTYSFSKDGQSCWDSDEWQGHVPVKLFDDDPNSWATSVSIL